MVVLATGYYAFLLYFQDRGIDGTIFQKLEKLHLTIGIMALMDDKEIQRAEELLKECKVDFIE